MLMVLGGSSGLFSSYALGPGRLRGSCNPNSETGGQEALSTPNSETGGQERLREYKTNSETGVRERLGYKTNSETGVRKREAPGSLINRE